MNTLTTILNLRSIVRCHDWK